MSIKLESKVAMTAFYKILRDVQKRIERREETTQFIENEVREVADRFYDANNSAQYFTEANSFYVPSQNVKFKEVIHGKIDAKEALKWHAHHFERLRV